MPTLLISLGNSPAIVPEAFLLPGVSFTEVHVLTTASATGTEVAQEWFRSRAPRVLFTVTRVDGFRTLDSEQDHFKFEEVLYRWYREKAPLEPPYVCHAGGFKTMSATVQKATTMLGAAEVFHVLCNLPPNEQPKTAEDIEAANAGGNLCWIRLGGESGWPQLRSATAEEFPLTTVKEDDGVRWVNAEGPQFRDRLREVVERSHNVAGAWNDLASLPFPVLATWSAADLLWLRERVDLSTDLSWLSALPKVELHCHLGGFATHGELLQQVKSAATDAAKLKNREVPGLLKGWPRPDTRIALQEYMDLGNANGTAILHDVGCLQRQCELLYEHFLSQKVAYAEVRCSPANYATVERSPWTVLSKIKEAFDDCMTRNPGCHVNLLIIATRREGGEFRTAISRHLSLAVTAAEHWTGEGECRVVGVDLAGYEDITTRAHLFREEFTAVHRCGLALTVHAGENDDAEGIWRAVFDLNARRLGHALELVKSLELMRSVADRGVALEMCPYANYQIKGFWPMPEEEGPPRDRYPLHEYLKKGIRVTLNTDNIGISAANLTDNFQLACEMCPELTRLDLLRLISNSADAAFISPGSRQKLRTKLEDLFAAPHRL